MEKDSICEHLIFERNIKEQPSFTHNTIKLYQYSIPYSVDFILIDHNLVKTEVTSFTVNSFLLCPDFYNFLFAVYG